MQAGILFKRVEGGQVEIYNNARIAQLVEHSTDTRAVPSSNLGSRTTSLKFQTSMLVWNFSFAAYALSAYL